MRRRERLQLADATAPNVVSRVRRTKGQAKLASTNAQIRRVTTTTALV